ncbi:MAG: peptidase S24 [Flavobacteriaceae bacterium]|nr:peptidase S24 [Flavobacteriaceae bacterium]
MEMKHTAKLKKVKKRHTAEVSKQTGFPSAATHYAEPSIDLHNELVTNQEATFFVRVAGNELEYFQIYNEDVLIVDRSLPPANKSLALVVQEGEFLIKEIQLQKLTSEYELWGIITYIIHKAT